MSTLAELSSEHTSGRIIVHEHVPQWFFSIGALIYASGFLVVFTFFDTLGLRETGVEFFKIKYLHVGILFLLFPALSGITVYGYTSIKRAERRRRKDGQMPEIPFHLATLIMIINLIAVFVLFVLFAPRGYVLERELLIPLIFVTTIIGLLVLRIIASNRMHITLEDGTGSSSTVTFEKLARQLEWWLCFGIVRGLDWYSFRGMGHDLWEMFSGYNRFTSGGYIFVLFLFLIFIMVWRANDRLAALTDPRLRMPTLVLTVGLTFCVFFLAILAFSYSVYPYIPAERGGGSYVESSPVILRFREMAGGAFPPEIVSGIGKNQSKPLIIIEETESMLYVADLTDSGGPSEWRRNRKRPKIFALRRDIIDCVSYNIAGV